MFFRIGDDLYKQYYNNLPALTALTKSRALKRIARFPIRAAEYELDQFLRKEYKVSLKTMCSFIVLNMFAYKTITNDVYFKIRKPDYDKIARIITYGTLTLPSSPILKYAILGQIN